MIDVNFILKLGKLELCILHPPELMVVKIFCQIDFGLWFVNLEKEKGEM